MKKWQITTWYVYLMGLALLVSNVMAMYDTLFKDDYTITSPVKAYLYQHRINNIELEQYQNASVVQSQTVIKIEHPTIWQRIFWPNTNGGDFIIQQLYFVSSICFLWILVLLKNHYNPFVTNLSKPLSIAAFTTMIIAIICEVRKHFINSEIEQLTRDNFSYDKYGNWNYSYLIWAGIFLLIVLNWYQKAYNLQEEQDLTI